MRKIILLASLLVLFIPCVCFAENIPRTRTDNTTSTNNDWRIHFGIGARWETKDIEKINKAQSHPIGKLSLTKDLNTSWYVNLSGRKDLDSRHWDTEISLNKSIVLNF